MKNPEIIQSWNTVNPDSSTQTRLLGAIMAASPLADKPVGWRRPVWRILVPVAASLALIAVGVPLLNLPQPIPLATSQGVSVGKVRWAPAVSAASDLVPLSEVEILAGVDIFSGTITKIDTIKVSFSDWSDYNSLITVQVDDVLRGNPGAEVKILVSPVISRSVHCSICEISSMLEVGVSAVFLATPASQGWAASLDGSEVFYYSDVAQYYLSDPARFLFIPTPNGVAFSTWGWPSLAAHASPTEVNGVSTVESVAIIEAFIHAIIDQ